MSDYRYIGGFALIVVLLILLWVVSVGGGADYYM